MDLGLYLSSKIISGKAIAITGSKSETNRLLLLQALYPHITILNPSESDDSIIMRNALNSSVNYIDVYHAGTAMRFLTAYFAMQTGKEVLLTGSQRMKERPVKILVEALRQLGADIEYVENEGFPPLKIRGRSLKGGNLSIKANISSQYITAMLLIAPKMEDGLKLVLQGEITSRPYIDMTLALLRESGFNFEFIDNVITVEPKLIVDEKCTIVVESDWSSASYFYSIVAMAVIGTAITLKSYKSNSNQGDSRLIDIYIQFGVATTFHDNEITLVKERDAFPEIILNLNDTPDIAQTIAVTCLGLGINCTLTGLHTLRIKETDRLNALREEMGKLGAKVNITNDRLEIISPKNVLPNIAIDTYNDHRMAMAFASLAVKIPVIIKDSAVVSKSYPSFWNNLQSIGIEVTPL